MVKRLSKVREPDEEETMKKRKAMDEMELRKLLRQNRTIKELRLRDSITEKQMKVIDALSKEQRNLTNNLTLMKSTRRCLLDAEQSQNVIDLFVQGDELDVEIAHEKRYIEDLEAEIRRESQTVQRVKKNMTDNATVLTDFLLKEENQRADRTLASWKSRLAAEHEQLGKATKENIDLRRRIDILLKEKGQFNQLFEELMQKLKKGKRIMADIVEQSKAQFQKKDEVTRKIGALQDRDKMDLVKRMEEMQDLEMKLYEDERLAAFRHKVQNLRVKLENGLRESKKENENTEKLSLRLKIAKEYFEELKEATELENPDEISDMIVKEDANLFSLFNFNNEIRDQLEVMTQKTAGMLRTVKEEQDAADEANMQNQKIKNMLTGKLLRMEEQVNDINDHLDANTRLFERLLSKIRALFDMIKCDWSPLEDLLGNNKEVTEFNYRLYLNIVESDLVELIGIMTPETKPTLLKSVSKVASYKSKLESASVHTRLQAVPSIVEQKKLVSRPCTECEATTRRN